MDKQKITVKSDIITKKSSDIRQVVRKAVAGLSDEELIERNSIGTYTEKKDDDEDNKKTD